MLHCQSHLNLCKRSYNVFKPYFALHFSTAVPSLVTGLKLVIVVLMCCSHQRVILGKYETKLIKEKTKPKYILKFICKSSGTWCHV